jgi:hypothetical protein
MANLTPEQKVELEALNRAFDECACEDECDETCAWCQMGGRCWAEVA